MNIKVSLCMIVKNEENVLDRCLASVAHLVDEVIIVDTGSTDKTKEIASKYTSKLYDFEWVNDFSAARNYAAEHATGDWILVLDADEFIDEENYQEFLNGLEEDNGEFDTYGVKIINFTGLYGEKLVQNYHDRVYKNNKEIAYYRAIHEQLKGVDGQSLNGSIAKLSVFHSGYMNQTVAEKGKNERNKDLLDKEMQESNNAFDYFNLGNEYYSQGEFEEALKAYTKAYNLKSSYQLSWVASTVIQIISVLIQLKRYNDAVNVIDDSIELYPGSFEMIFLKGEISFVRGQYDDAKYYFEEIINNSEKYNHTILRPDLKDQMPHRRLGDIYNYEKVYDKAIYHYMNVLNINKLDSDSIIKIIFILNKFHTEDEIIQFIERNDLINKNNLSYYMTGCFDIGKPNIIEPFLKYNNEDKLLEKIYKLKNYCLTGTGNIEEFNDLLNPKLVERLNQKQMLNIIDLYFLRSRLLEGNQSPLLITAFEKDEHVSMLVKLLNNLTVGKLDESELFLGSLQILMNYKKYDLASNLLNNKQLLTDSALVKAAAILYENDFKGEGLQLYNACDWDVYTEQDFLNIINGLFETGNDPNAIEFTKYANLLFENDFRFYKILLENPIDDHLFNTTVKKALETFKGSVYLEKYLL
ncbi:glycosyltransferase [Bacillales bacterium AN1005]|uniref:glycosyltransferase n=1 Tax=Niallia taxi TaxID=2499688 RepID=UPI0011A5ECF7|nr:TPR domain-containing glycosyltransferase [Niallia taxi]MCT2347580.1 glycosyltransferase [Niallia taxi]MED3963926.1 glycosyltransferase [Niallia taxi]